MRAGRARGRKHSAARPAGFSLIELMVVIAILAVLLTVALPSFADWIRNNQVRTAAESLREGLQLARSEAIKRNVRMRFQLVTSLDNSCALSASGPYWIVNAGASVTPAGACASAVSATVAPNIVQASPATAATTKVTLTASVTPAVVAFDAAGRQSATTNPTSAVVRMVFKFESPSGSCVKLGGTVRCLIVIVTTAGEVRMCDPAVTSSTDPGYCPLT